MANVILDGVTYNGVDKVSLKDVDNVGQRVDFVPAPTLITKNITANGTYAAASDNADGYSLVTVNVQQQILVEKDVNFYDYDGTLVASYTATDFANLTAMPANPSHTGLTAQGWNWTLSDAKTYVASYGKLNIGQMYTTTSGKTEIDITINEETGFTATLDNNAEKDWGDGTVDYTRSHTYSTEGNYTIKFGAVTLTYLPRIMNSKKVIAVRFGSTVTNFDNSMLRGCRALQSVTIPNSVTSIGNGAFNQCYSLQSITIPNSVTGIGSEGCSNCYALQSITIPNSVTSIGSNAFNQCYSLQSITIPNSVTSIGSSAFNKYYLLQSITIPSSVTSIGDSAFYGCDWLTIMTVLATTPPTLSATNAIPSSVTKIYIPNGTLADYQGASNWSNFSAKFVELPA